MCSTDLFTINEHGRLLFGKPLASCPVGVCFKVGLAAMAVRSVSSYLGEYGFRTAILCREVVFCGDTCSSRAQEFPS